MSALPKPLELPEDEISEEESEEEEYSDEEWDELEQANKRVERITDHLRVSLTKLYDECRHQAETRISLIGKAKIEQTEKVILAEIASLACMGNIEGVQILQGMLQDIMQIEADLRCAVQYEYEIRFGPEQKILTDST